MTYTQKYKDKDPLETIENIKKFFHKQNYEIKTQIIYFNKHSNTYWCTLELYYKNNLYLSQNGKGATKLFCLASGYAELFERYCSNYSIYMNNFLYTKYCQQYKINNNCTFEELLNNNIFQQYFIDNGIESIEELQIFIPYLHTNTYLSLLNSNNTKEFPMPLLYHINGSTGLAAGNSIEEALNQGIAEICERYVLSQFILEDQASYFVIDKDNISNSTILNIINSIESNNNKILIFDLSYNFNLPVCLVILLDLTNLNIHYRLGSFPIFDIALERCLTELYQGMLEEQNFNFKNYIPFKSIHNKKQEIYNAYVSLIYSNTINEKIFNYNLVNQPSATYLLNDKEYTNQEILNYWQSLMQEQNIELYWRQLSPIEENNIFAVHIYPYNLDMNISYTNNLTAEEKKEKIKFYKYYQDLGWQIINNKNYSLDNFNKIKIKNKQKFYQHILFDFYNIYPLVSPSLSTVMIFNTIFYDNAYEELLKYDKSFYYHNIKKYYLFNQLITNQYTDEEIALFLQKLQIFLNNDIIKQMQDKKYILRDILFNNFLQNYQNFNMLDFINHEKKEINI